MELFSLGGLSVFFGIFHRQKTTFATAFRGPFPNLENPSPLSHNLLKGRAKNVWQAVHVGWFFEGKKHVFTSSIS